MGKYGRSGEIRTPDPLLPKQLRYQAALHSDNEKDLYTCGTDTASLFKKILLKVIISKRRMMNIIIDMNTKLSGRTAIQL